MWKSQLHRICNETATQLLIDSVTDIFWSESWIETHCDRNFISQNVFGAVKNKTMSNKPDDNISISAKWHGRAPLTEHKTQYFFQRILLFCKYEQSFRMAEKRRKMKSSRKIKKCVFKSSSATNRCETNGWVRKAKSKFDKRISIWLTDFSSICWLLLLFEFSVFWFFRRFYLFLS